MTERTSKNSMLHIDGAQGEGGGQILRSSLALSMATGTPFRMTGIRAGRAKPGLMRQHLTCVQAAADISSAHVSGAVVGSTEISFEPGPVRSGDYHFQIGTAGGTTLVLQAVLPALLVADGGSTITVEGGTHNRAAPPFEFLERALVPILNRAGAGLAVRLERHGFYPAGGGRVVTTIDPARAPTAIALAERGERQGARATAIVSRLSPSIAHRELKVLRDRLGLQPDELEAVLVERPIGPGNAAFVELRYEHVTEVFSAVGEVGKSAETVAREVADEARDYIAAQVAAGPYLADQLMVPLALLAGGRYATGPLTDHSATNMAVIEAFGGRVAVQDGTLVVEQLLRRARQA
ncbi:MAG: RNA 3'-terminal phosphate cyclase [Phycisphaerales bacterium]|nr:RNA 3'-terminal phosphate cyclase [Phycisphaerales bacterium]